jgi:hypothetical protein
MVFAKLKNFFAKLIFFPAKFFFAQKDFPFPKYQKVLAGKNQLSKKDRSNFFWNSITSNKRNVSHQT